MSNGAARRPASIAVSGVLAVLVVAVLASHALLAHSLNVHWDELNFLSKIHAYARGELATRILTFHVHLLGWVRATDPNEIVQVVRLREVMLAMNIMTAVLAFLVGRRLLGTTASALFAVLAGQSLSYVMHHGTSARFDPLVVALVMLAAALLVLPVVPVVPVVPAVPVLPVLPVPPVPPGAQPRATSRASTVVASAAVAGVALAVALMVSVKAVFFAPTLAGLVVCPMVFAEAREVRTVLRRALLAFVVVTALAFAMMFALHDASLADLPGAAAEPSTGSAASAGPFSAPQPPPGTLHRLLGVAATVFQPALGVVHPRVFLDTLRWDGVFWALLVAGMALALFMVFAKRARASAEERSRHAQLLCFALPLTALAFYRNSFAYFYVCLVPPAALLAGVVVARIESRLATRPWLAVALVVALTIPGARSAFLFFTYNSDEQLSAQKLVVDAVHSMFPMPVPYVDRCAMIASFPKVGPFMSTWTLGEYRAKGTPIMRDLLARHRPHFVLANVSTLELDRPFKKGPRFYRLLRDDFELLKASYIAHWGPVWVAGKTLDLAADTPVDVQLLVAGRYVVEASARVTLDGNEVAPGDVVELGGLPTHALASAVAQRVTLRIASAGPPPRTPPPTEPLFRGFQYRRSAREDVGDDEAGDDDDERATKGTLP